MRRAALDGATGVGAHSGALGQLLLRHGGVTPIAPQQPHETFVWRRIHPPSFLALLRQALVHAVSRILSRLASRVFRVKLRACGVLSQRALLESSGQWAIERLSALNKRGRENRGD